MDRTVTVHISESLYELIRDRAALEHLNTGKRFCMGRAALKMLEAHLLCEEREICNAKKRPVGSKNKGNTGLLADNPLFLHQSSGHILCEHPVVKDLFDLGAFGVSVRPEPIPGVKETKRETQEPAMVTPEMIQEVIDASNIMTFIDEFRAWQKAQREATS